LLFTTSVRDDSDEENLCEGAFDALRVIIASAPDRTVDGACHIVPL
jgi:hypothetical protein